MKIFKRNQKLLQRIQSLEDVLGYIYSVDTDGYACHQLTRGSYSDMTKALDGLKKALDGLKELSSSKKVGK